MKLSDFNLLDDDNEKASLKALIQSFNQTQTDYPRDKTVHALFSEQAKRTPNAIAVICGETTQTYRELEQQSNQLAHCLLTQFLQPEALVAVMLDRSHDMVVALLGILKAGGAYLPLNHDLPFKRLQYILRETQARFLIASKDNIRIINKLQWSCPDLKVILCPDSLDIYAESEGIGEMMTEDMWDFIRRDTFDEISGGGWKSSYTGEWLSPAVMEDYAENIRLKLSRFINKDKSSRILEIGCASGISLFSLAPLAGFYYATDLSQNILVWTAGEIKKRGLTQVQLAQFAAHEIDLIAEKEFDIVILNSVIQCFSGHNYLRDVLKKAIALMKNDGILFLGNVWDQDLQYDFIQSLESFEKQNVGKGYITKTDRFEELFIEKAFLNDLRQGFPEIAAIQYSKMLGTTQSELSEYSYDVIIHINKKEMISWVNSPRHEYQFDRSTLATYPIDQVEKRSQADGLAYVMYTSGTLGQPKGVMIEHRSILRLVLKTNYISLQASDRILQTGSLAFDASTFEIWGPLLNGGAVCLSQEEDFLNADKLKQLIEQHEITTCWLTASLFNLLVGMNINLFQSLKTVIVGGEKLSVHHVNQVRQAYPSLILKNGYGPTENTTFTTCYTVDSLFEQDIPIGRPISNTTVYILDSHHELVPIGVAGEIYTGGDGLARGYWHDSALTKQKFIPHPFEPHQRLYRTGDLGRWLADGSIEFLGRQDEQVKVRGYRIELGEIEHQLLQHEAVKEAVVIAKDLGPDSTELLAYVTLQSDLEINSLRDDIKTVLPEYMMPTYFTQLEKMPLTANGKINKRALPAPALALPQRHTQLKQKSN